MELERGMDEGIVVGESIEIEPKRARTGEGESFKTVPRNEEGPAPCSGESLASRFPWQQIALRKIASWSRAALTRSR